MSFDAAKAHEEERARQKAAIKALEEAEKKKAWLEKTKKKRMLIRGGGSAIVIIAFLTWFLLAPLKGPVQYGICRTILELGLKFPQTLKMTYVETFDKSLIMYYTYTDAFGSTKSEMMECAFRPFNMMWLENVKINRRPIDPEKVKLYNMLIPVIASTKPDLTIPGLPKDNLMDLKRD